MNDQTIQTEQWKAIKEWPDYEISSQGRVRRGSKLISLFKIDGYLSFNVCINYNRKSLRVHREVAKAFVENPGTGDVVRHKNGIFSECCAENLEWGTHTDNMRDKERHGTAPVGSRNPAAKLTEADVIDILGSFETNIYMASKYGVCVEMISRIRNGHNWRRI